MKHKMYWILVAGLGVILTLGTAQAFAFEDEQGAPGEPPVGHGYGMMGMRDDPGLREELGLTEEQVKQLRALRLDAAKNGIRARSELQFKRLELEELLEADEPDRAAIDKKLRELSDARYAWMKQRVDHRLALRGVLTPEQRNKWQSLRRRHLRQRWHQRRRLHRPGGEGMGPGFGPGRGFGPGFGQQVAPPPPPED